MKNETIRKTYVPCPVWKRLLYRFARGFFSAFVPLFSSFAAMTPNEWRFSLVFSIVLSSVAGGLQAVEKLWREIEDQKEEGKYTGIVSTLMSP